MTIAYDTAAEIISDVALEVGLGAIIGDPFGSQDANILQLCGLLKSGGRKLVFSRDWTYLVAEYTFVTYPNWTASTVYRSSNTLSLWAQGTSYSTTTTVIWNNGNWYQVTTPGTSSLTSNGPQTTDPSIIDGSVIWKYLSTGTAQVVVKGKYAYQAAFFGTSGTVGPVGIIIGATEQEGTAQWTNIGFANAYPLPDGFSNMLDQTGWNRTNRLPLGGPVSAQEWQYLKGRQQGVVFNVLFRPDDDTIRLYPDTDPPGLNTIAFEYISRFWISTVGSQQDPDSDTPSSGSDIVFFDPLLMTRRLKLDWLAAKGFDTSLAMDDYNEVLEQCKNADGSAPQLNLRGGRGEPLISIANIPVTGYGS